METIRFPSELTWLADHFSRHVAARYSCRTFTGAPLPAAPRRSLEAVLDALNLVAAGRLRMQMIPAGDLRRENLFTRGTYGLIRRPAAYLAGVKIIGEDTAGWMEYGRVMQTAVLAATALDLQSCWIGGVFDRATFSRLTRLEKGETVPAVVALGTAAQRPSLRDRVVRWSARGNTRRPFGELFFNGQWGVALDRKDYPRLTPLLDNLRRAPSASNRQPWRVVVRENRMDLYLVRTPGYRRLTPGVDLQALDMGIALCHLEWSARERGFSLEAKDPPVAVSGDAEALLSLRPA